MAHPKQQSTDNYSKRSTATSKESSSSPSLINRPIATNSRVKQDEKYRKDMYLAFVHNALQQKAEGTSDSFDELVNQFNPESLSTQGIPQLTQLRLWILALSHVVSRLERVHSALVDAIVNMPWTTLDTATVKSYTVFIGMLVSARPEYLSLVLSKVAQGFTHQSGLQTLDAAMPEGSTSPMTRRIIYDRLHGLLRHLLSLIPTLSSTLQPLLVRNFPHKRQNQLAQTTYIRNLLRICVYCPELADKILATIIDRAIQIDVEIQVELEEIEEEENNQDQDVFELDPFDTLVGQEEADSDDGGNESEEEENLSDLSSDAGDMDDIAQITEIPTNIKHIQDMVKKLDAILTLLFDHFHRTHKSVTTSGVLTLPPLLDLPPLPPLDSPLLTTHPTISDLVSITQLPSAPSTPTPPPPESQSVGRSRNLLRIQFNTLLSIFDRTILRTFKSRYTQFLIFWYTSLDPEFSDTFQGMLVDRALFENGAKGMTHNNTSAVTRAAAASYIGSFVSRASFVHREDARRVVGILCEFLRVHLETVEELHRDGGLNMNAGGMAQNTVFYAVAQTVFLIFCFRWRDLQEESDGEDEILTGGAGKTGKKWMPQLSILQRVVTSVLNPLRVCSPNVVTQFARVAHATDFIYCYTILESNKRSEYGSNNAEGRVHPSVSSVHQRSRSGIHPAMLDGSVVAELNTFFPFDPYRLPKSNAYIRGIYREWSSVAIDDDDDDEEDEDEEDEVSYSRGPQEMAPSGHLDIPRSSHSAVDEGGLGESLGAMSISPVRLPFPASETATASS
ncbi:RNA polymerase I-specific transcription initiation factor RRN3 [Collybia nuda]|uniref:RNA polymerase I-specific transcription initiation factor RRN3 n=1 Tax=Collybia nuda TaxID=64659 RepID=A0A9P6CG46_9AGAR|nr:RNA polymerase I-specific transcription initiation factor RRN3 [Collybia nuda]